MGARSTSYSDQSISTFDTPTPKLDAADHHNFDNRLKLSTSYVTGYLMESNNEKVIEIDKYNKLYIESEINDTNIKENDKILMLKILNSDTFPELPAENFKNIYFHNKFCKSVVHIINSSCKEETNICVNIDSLR